MQECAWFSSKLILDEGLGVLLFLELPRLSFLIFMGSRILDMLTYVFYFKSFKTTIHLSLLQNDVMCHSERREES